MRVRDLCIISGLTTILFVQEQLLSFIPGVQFTFLLIIIYARCIGVKKTLVIVFLHSLLDNILFGSLMLFLPMFLGYGIIPFILMFVDTDNSFVLSLLTIVFVFWYCLVFIPFNIIFFDVDFLTYLLADIPFTMILAGFSFLTVLWLYQPLARCLNNLLCEQKVDNE